MFHYHIHVFEPEMAIFHTLAQFLKKEMLPVSFHTLFHLLLKTCEVNGFISILQTR